MGEELRVVGMFFLEGAFYSMMAVIGLAIIYYLPYILLFAKITFELLIKAIAYLLGAIIMLILLLIEGITNIYHYAKRKVRKYKRMHRIRKREKAEAKALYEELNGKSFFKI